MQRETLNNENYGHKDDIVRRWLEIAAEDLEVAESMRFIAHIEPMYIEARYPEQKAAAARTLSRDVSQYFIEQTKELTQWIEKRLHESKPSTPSESTSE